MTLRIERTSSGGNTALKLIGQIRSDDLEGLTAELRVSGVGVVLDLDELTLVDAAVVRFLGAREGDGVGLINCPPYIREWIKRERARS